MKKVIRQPITVKHRDCFVMSLEHEHGDADFTTQYNLVLQSYTDEELIAAIETFNQVATLVERIRSGAQLTDQERVACRKAYDNGWIEYDKAYSNAIDYYAAPAIAGILYYDKEGHSCQVTVNEAAEQ